MLAKCIFVPPVDTTMMRPPARTRRPVLLQCEEHAFGISIENVVVVFFSALDKRLLDMNPGIGDNDVERPRHLLGFAKQSLYLSGLGNIGLHGAHALPSLATILFTTSCARSLLRA